METPFIKIHRELKATFTEFHGWKLPLHYGSAIDEVRSVRKESGIFDISHMGRIVVKGEGVKDILNRLLSNNLEKLSPGKVQYNLFMNEKGGIKDDVTVYCIDDSEYFICVNAANKDKIVSWLSNFVNVEDISGSTVQIALQGPGSTDILGKFFDVSEIAYYSFRKFGNLLISRTGYTGELGYEIYAPVSEGYELFYELIKLSKPCGLASRDVLRIEVGFPLYGNEIDEDITPMEAGLEKFVDMKKDFIGKESLLSFKPSRRLIGFLTEERGIPRKGYEIIHDDKVVGHVTSGTFSPTYNTGVGMAFVNSEYLEAKGLSVKVRDKLIKIDIKDNLLRYLKTMKNK